MNRVVLCIGSNLEPRHARVSESIKKISFLLDAMRYSALYETPEIHGIGRPYVNVVVAGNCPLDLDNLNAQCKRLEEEAGRTPEARSRGDVPVDIDIVIWNGEVVRPNDARQHFFRIGAAQLGLV